MESHEDSSYNSEVDSDPDSDPDNPEKLLNTWLGELDSLTVGLDRGGPARPLSSDLNPPRIDSYRFSMANLEDSQDVDLDAILGELCALESQYDEALATTSAKPGGEMTHRRTTSDTPRTDSPDNDSAFSDSVSLLSSESSASSGRTDSHSQVDCGNGKTEKIRLALQKMKEASVKKLFIKVFSGDGSAKSLMVDETMSCGYVTRVLADKNHQGMEPQWALMEHLPDLHLERVYEDHEPLVDNLMIWTRDSKNRLLFVKRPERTMIFEQPELLSGPNNTTRGDNVDECSKNNMIEELFSGSCVPSMEGPLYVKSDAKKGWKRHHCILRASGLYYLPKDKAKTSYKDLVCLATFDVNQVYYGVGWRKKFKAPTEFCFALKHPSLQQVKSSKYIKFLCADDQTTLHQWVLAIRMAKHGRQLLVNYRALLEESRISNCERIRETSVRHSTISSSSLLDTASESGSSGCDVGFECDFPSGTIKRKPPKLPLTATTRQLTEIASNKHIERATSFESLPPPPPEVLENLIHPDEDLPPPPPPPRLAPPSTAFLQDLQRVMRRKWQVAQKCKLDHTTTPHEVLGFRDPPDYRETNVSNWVAEHYGGQNLYENVYRPPGCQGMQLAPPKKRPPPPPPPPRAETTHLTSRHPQKC
ncbi:amyloid beta A4 precursor protein-binding family B member 1-interacting protein-like isoform X1 [Homalodisca vitripennis]|uniref:amyloid beta A4 precursor protein-binding family B member 1-interacting protein-like isoform X1 n=1 Tax=Homalodisca vitripennis TaxID=197043 RepID=UPI001EEA1AF4|nr:amyloid beta A4 precursor protein-binding family B member 1-interacting protein-like isoform X1 [Homalodisca vitripennis]XP_046670898.1 amyloid beta A4 precursor protein-binding family B member 1-interacting protein-like isoform X1 [Homalodisca vitripennis]